MGLTQVGSGAGQCTAGRYFQRPHVAAIHCTWLSEVRVDPPPPPPPPVVEGFSPAPLVDRITSLLLRGAALAEEALARARARLQD
ncbi:MAG: hypothetical protein M3394_08720 [Actinomycetota bacterium]|nr:hypothetical protein [Actinomycetota bacterium]